MTLSIKTFSIAITNYDDTHHIDTYYDDTLLIMCPESLISFLLSVIKVNVVALFFLPIKNASA
jgi:hypothetical protein